MSRLWETDARAAASSIYGTILVTALVATLSEDEGVDAWQILVGVTLTTLVFWAAHAYADALGRQAVHGHGPSLHELGRSLAREWPMVRAGVPAAVALALAALGVYSDDTGVNLAIGLGVATLFASGLLLARREHVTPFQGLVAATVNGAFGMVIVALKVYVH